ncbi:hypothetical protein JK635_00755 [Neobacillus sp. YIM B02564]|uniref:Uncharacterized protein n=1 Tax=Neobacillus paridis TaxID=2803862 RepID=A0ABS1TJ66_9BACI|nr:hypothetical protein [Neobacillus paridis]MBL4950774.1 hypothetical protein [Neobacillus paridis]
MNFEMQKANLLSENINSFIKYVRCNYENNNSFPLNRDKVYQIKLLTEEYKFQIIADELQRINQFSWDAKYTHYLVNQFQQGMDIIDEYVRNHYDELFIFAARVYTLRTLSQAFTWSKTIFS